MMHFQTPTISNLLSAAISAARARTELLILLALLAGILSSIVYWPALKVINDFSLALEASQADQAMLEEAARIFNEGASTLLFGHLAVTGISAFLLVPWARAVAPGKLLPAAGGTSAFLRRGTRSFLHMVAASGLSILFLLVAVQFAGGLSVLPPALSGIAVVALFCLIIWVGFALSGTAHLAVAAEARDRRETLYSAFVRARLFMPPIVGSLALILLCLMTLNVIVGSVLLALVPDSLQLRLSSIIGGAVFYFISALHVAASYVVPDFRDLAPSAD